MDDFRELSSNEYNRLSYEEQQIYLQQLFKKSCEEEVDVSSECLSDICDSDGDEWVPSASLIIESDVEDVNTGPNEIEIEELVSENDDDNNNEIFSTVGNNNSELVTDLPGKETHKLVQTYVSKDGTQWSSDYTGSNRKFPHNILRGKYGPSKSTQMLSAKDTFKCIFSKEMCSIILKETNRKAKSVMEGCNASKSSRLWKQLDDEEFDAYLGILITAGVRHSNNENTKEMWSTQAYPLYRACMSINRFWQISRFLRFDNDTTRIERQKIDKAAAISDLFVMMNYNLRHHYQPSESLTVDEQLFPFRGRTRFTQYMPSKPAKYGIKVWWICDSKNSYPLAGQIYTGKKDATREKNQGERVVKDLCYYYKGSGRNIVTDNFFTSLPLARLLMTWNLSLLGTIKKNKPYIPKEMLPSSSRQDLSSLFGFTKDNITICSYVPKKNKAVLLLSTMHYDKSTSGHKAKPHMITDYNKLKGGVDNMDKLCSHFSVKRRTQRWPVAFFYNLLDIAALAAYKIYAENNPQSTKNTQNRRLFLQELGKQLSMPAIERRSKNSICLKSFSTNSGIECMLGKPISADHKRIAVVVRDATGRLPILGNCIACQGLPGTQKRKRKTRKSCINCESPVCDEHCLTITKCRNCE